MDILAIVNKEQDRIQFSRVDESVNGGTDKLVIVDLWGEVFCGSVFHAKQRGMEKLAGGNAGFVWCEVEPLGHGNPRSLALPCEGGKVLYLTLTIVRAYRGQDQ